MTSTPEFSPDQYINDRVEQYQAWYDQKAIVTKSRHLYMKAFSVVGGGLVPVLVNIEFHTLWGMPINQLFITTVLSLIVVICVSLESVYHYREQWKNYRSTEQALGHEKFFFRSRVGRYHGLSEEDAFRVLVERVEELIAVENSATLNVMTMASEPSDANKKS